MVARVLVVLSDGQNNAGVVSLERGHRCRSRSRSHYLCHQHELPNVLACARSGRRRGNSDLRKLAEQTGGRILFPYDPKQVAKAFVKIREELRSRYAVSYKPAEFTPDGHYRTIKIEARKTGENLEIRTRKGYYARAASWLSSRRDRGQQLYSVGDRVIASVHVSLLPRQGK